MNTTTQKKRKKKTKETKWSIAAANKLMQHAIR